MKEKKMKNETADYSKYEGQELLYHHNTTDDKPINLIVIGCEKGIGITLALTETPTVNIICLNGPDSPINSFDTWPNKEMALEVHNALFDYVIKCIDRGYFIGSEFQEIKNSFIPGQDYADKLRCSFSQ